MEPITIGIIDRDPRAHALFQAAMRDLPTRLKGQPIALAEELTGLFTAGKVGAWNQCREWLAGYRGALLLFVDFDLGLSPLERQNLRDEFRGRPDRVASDAEEQLLAEDTPDGLILAMHAILNPNISQVMLVHNARGGNADLFSLLTEFGATHRLTEPGRPNFACLLRPTNLGVTAFSHPNANQEITSRLIKWAVGEFGTRLPRNDPLKAQRLLEMLRAATHVIAGSGWFDKTGDGPLFATPLPFGAAASPDTRTTHDLGNWDEAVFAAFDAKRALTMLNGLFKELSPDPLPKVLPGLDGCWPLSCLKALEHALPHRALLLAAARRDFAGLLDTGAEHRRQIKLKNTGEDGLQAMAGVLAALCELRLGFTADQPEMLRKGDTEILRLMFTTKQQDEKLDEVALAAVTQTVDRKRKEGHPTGGSFTRSCDWLRRHASNFWVGRVREEKGERMLTIAIEFEEGRLR